MKFGTRVSSRSGNANFYARPRESRDVGGVHPVRRTCLRACLSRPDGRQATHRQASDPAD
ncbi:MAG: hypothetical protein DRH37_10930 [Deltaproteobacteria bacterium]|nr:MAG: hypothetical protein DRH37_10930 [Deltaproteobacteria bacterium]